MNPLRFYSHCLIEKIKSERAAARGSKQEDGSKWGESPSEGEQTVCAALSYLKMEKQAKKRMEKGRKRRIKHLPRGTRGRFCSCLLALILFNERIPAGSQFSAERCAEAGGRGPSATSPWGQDRGSQGSRGCHRCSEGRQSKVRERLPAFGTRLREQTRRKSSAPGVFPLEPRRAAWCKNIHGLIYRVRIHYQPPSASSGDPFCQQQKLHKFSWSPNETRRSEQGCCALLPLVHHLCSGCF